jgi:hypothetical protein
MPEPPDFEQIARRVVDLTDAKVREPFMPIEGDRVVAALVAQIIEQLRQVWNARGAADLAIVNTELSAHLGEIGYSASTLEMAVMLAIQSMDR